MYSNNCWSFANANSTLSNFISINLADSIYKILYIHIDITQVIEMFSTVMKRVFFLAQKIQVSFLKRRLLAF